MTPIRKVLALSLLALLLTAGFGPVAHAAGETSFGPLRITGIPAAGGLKIQQLGASVTVAMEAGQTAYVYSSLNAYSAAQVTLVDNEVRCSGSGRGDVVLGENIDPAGSANTDRVDITIVNRFLVSATSSGTLTCEIFYRGHSMSNLTSALTVAGGLKIAAMPVGEDASGVAIQTSLPVMDPITVSTYVYTLEIDRTLAASHTKVDVIADVQFMSCWPKGQASCGHSSTRSDVRFTLYVNQMNGDTVCTSAPRAQSSVSVLKQTHHKVVPLYTSLNLAPGCRRLVAYVKAEYLGGPTGAIQGAASPLPDEDGTGTHTSVMSHIFALPR